MSIIDKCTCEHKSQDELNGRGNRVFNKTTKKVGEQPVFRCTACGKEKTKGKEKAE